MNPDLERDLRCRLVLRNDLVKLVIEMREAQKSKSKKVIELEVKVDNKLKEII